jgi:predicted Zn-dependent protease
MSIPVGRAESPHEPLTASQRRAEALRRAAHNKQQAAATRAEAAIRQLIKNQEEIHFRSVARTGGVSLDFLYSHPDLRQRIESLRAQQTRTPAPCDQPDTSGNIVHVLTGKLRAERAARQAAVKELQERLAATHGEILRLRRVLQQHGIEP